jgi:polysaccharide export outer membrane protein
MSSGFIGFISTPKRALVFGAAVVFTFTGIAAAQNTTTTHAMNEDAVRNSADVPRPVASSKAAPDYIIGPGDILSIDVMNEPDVTGKVPVRPDGMISVPLIGDIQASGLTPDKLQAAITTKLTDYVRQPSVTVVVEEMNSRQFNVMGKVQHPGSFALNKPTRVLDALALAGGFNEFAKTSKVYVLRTKASGATIRLPFNYKKVSAGEDDQDNIQLQAGDTVIVP